MWAVGDPLPTTGGGTWAYSAFDSSLMSLFRIWSFYE